MEAESDRFQHISQLINAADCLEFTLGQLQQKLPSTTSSFFAIKLQIHPQVAVASGKWQVKDTLVHCKQLERSEL